MVKEALINLFARDLGRLKTEIGLYKDEKNLWIDTKGISNSGGNLCLHLIGNLNTYIGAGIGGIIYQRDRNLEFSAKNVPAGELIRRIDETIVFVQEALNKLDDSQLQEHFPVVIWDEPTEMNFTLLHLLSHLNYHLGQVNYHRRLLDY